MESSCDETAVAILKNGREVLANVVSTQIELHKKFGGVVPEVASRKHIENIDAVFQEAIDEANIKLEDIDVNIVFIDEGEGWVIDYFWISTNGGEDVLYNQ